VKPESLARSGVTSLVGSAFAALAAFVLTIVISRGYGPDGTGVFFQAIAVFSVVSQVLRLGTNSAIIRFVSAQRALTGVGDSWRVTLAAIVPVAIVSGITGACLALFASPLAAALAPRGYEADLAGILRTMAPFVVAGSVLAVLQTVTRLVNGVGTFTLLQSILLPLSRLAVAITAIALALGIDAAVLGWMAVLPLWLAVTVLVLVRPLRRDHLLSRSLGERVSWRTFWAFSAPRAVGASLETALDWSDVLIVAALTSPAEAGIYAVATRAVRAGQIIDRAMRIAVSPTISRLLAEAELHPHRLDDARRLHTAVTRLLILTAWPFYLALAILAPSVLSLFGPGFESGSAALAILAAAMMLSSASGMLQSVLLQGGRSSWQMYNKAGVLTINIALSLALVPMLGITGAAVSWLACIAVDTAIAAWQVHRGLGVRLEPRAIAVSTLLPLVVVGLGCTALRLLAVPAPLDLAVGVPTLALLYAITVWLLRSRLGIDRVLQRLIPERLIPRFVRGNRNRAGARVTEQQAERAKKPATTGSDRQ